MLRLAGTQALPPASLAISLAISPRHLPPLPPSQSPPTHPAWYFAARRPTCWEPCCPAKPRPPPPSWPQSGLSTWQLADALDFSLPSPHRTVTPLVRLPPPSPQRVVSPASSLPPPTRALVIFAFACRSSPLPSPTLVNVHSVSRAGIPRTAAPRGAGHPLRLCATGVPPQAPIGRLLGPPQRRFRGDACLGRRPAVYAGPGRTCGPRTFGRDGRGGSARRGRVGGRCRRWARWCWWERPQWVWCHERGCRCICHRRHLGRWGVGAGGGAARAGVP